jgi:serine/threonine protein kinase
VDDELIRRYEQAAAVAAQLRHPHLVPIHKFGVTTSLLWYSMESVKGRPLQAVLERGPLGRSACGQLLEQMASGLEYLHRNGVVHGGLTPLTVMVDGDGWVRITDSGIGAALYRAAVPRSDWEGVLDPAYAAPEVIERRLVGPAADQYSLAVLAYQCLAGRPPWTGETLEVVLRERSQGAEPLEALQPDIPPYTATAVVRALREAPAERFASVLDFVSVLSGAVVRPTSGLAPGPASNRLPLLVMPDNEPPAPPRRHRLAVLFLLLAAAAAVWGFVQLTSPPVERWVQAPRGGTPSPATTSDSAPALPAEAQPAAPVPAPAATPPPERRPPVARVEQSATLFVNASPWGVVYLDGRPIGNTPRANLPVPAGVHVLRVVREGFVPFEREIRLEPGQVLRITDIVLEPIRP